MLCDTCADKNYCEPHRRLGENIVICGAYKKPPTNADRIREMSDKELALAIRMTANCDLCPINNCNARHYSSPDDCEKHWLDWLQSPAEEVEV